MNAATKQASGDILAFTDDDCEARPDWLSVVAACFAENPAVGLVAGDVVPAPKSSRFELSTCPAAQTPDYTYVPRDHAAGAPPGWYFIGANMAVRRDVFDLVGGFDPFLGVGTDFPSCEDVDFGLRAEELGVVMRTSPRSVVFHTYGRRSGLRNLLRHHRGYAVGSGALGGKLALWNHRLANGFAPKKAIWESIHFALRHPPRWGLDRFKLSYVLEGKKAYLEAFALGDKRLSVNVGAQSR